MATAFTMLPTFCGAPPWRLSELAWVVISMESLGVFLGDAAIVRIASLLPWFFSLDPRFDNFLAGVLLHLFESSLDDIPYFFVIVDSDGF